MIQLVNYDTGRAVLERVSLRSTFFGRLTGYLAKDSQDIPGILFLDTPRVHTIGMRFARLLKRQRKGVNAENGHAVRFV